MTKEHIDIIKKLDELKRKIQNSSDLEAMGYLIKAVVNRIQKGELIVNDKEGLKMIIEMLMLEESRISDGTYPDADTARFQLSASIVQSMIALTGVGIDELDNILKQ